MAYPMGVRALVRFARTQRARKKAAARVLVRAHMAKAVRARKVQARAKRAATTMRARAQRANRAARLAGKLAQGFKARAVVRALMVR